MRRQRDGTNIRAYKHRILSRDCPSAVTNIRLLDSLTRADQENGKDMRIPNINPLAFPYPLVPTIPFLTVLRISYSRFTPGGIVKYIYCYPLGRYQKSES